ncbi:MAG: transposase [Planctomycetia bacterium]|nr:transposase [Planctomycetia bacterium]
MQCSPPSGSPPTASGLSSAVASAEIHWRQFLQSLQERGMYGVKLVVSDDHSGLKAARHATMPGVPSQRCQFHTSQNAMAHAPKVPMRVEVADDIRRIYNADDRAEADRRLKDIVGRYHKTAPALASWLEENIPEASTVFAFPSAHRKRLRTENGLERLNKEIKRRTRVATLFPNEASLLRLVSPVLSEISDDWATERAYLTMEAR